MKILYHDIVYIRYDIIYIYTDIYIITEGNKLVNNISLNIYLYLLYFIYYDPIIVHLLKHKY